MLFTKVPSSLQASAVDDNLGPRTGSSPPRMTLLGANCAPACSENRGKSWTPGVARATFLFYYGLKPGRFPRLNLSTFNLGVTFQLCSHPRSLYPQRKPVISCNKAWKNSKGALKVARTDTEKAGASRVKAQRGSILGSTVPRAKIQTKPLVPGDSRQKETHRPSVTRTEWGSGGSGCHPVREAGRRLRSAPTRWAKRGGGCSVAGRSTQPLLPGPSLPPSPRPGLSRLLFPCFASLPPLPPDTAERGPLPPKAHQLPHSPASPHLSGARRNCRPGGSSGRPPSSLLAFASLTGEGRPEEEEARSRGGRRSGRSARSCFPAFPREKKERGPSRLRARRRRRRCRPLYRAAPPGARATPASASMPPPPPPAPRFPRAAPHSASSSHAAAQGYTSRRLHESPPRSPCARASPLPRRRLPGTPEKESGPCARPRLGDPGRPAGRAEAGGRGKAARRRIPMGFFPGPAPSALPAEGVKRRRTTSETAWSGLLSAARPGRRLRGSLCGRCRPSQVGLPGLAGRHLGRGGGGRRGAAGGGRGRRSRRSTLGEPRGSQRGWWA